MSIFDNQQPVNPNVFRPTEGLQPSENAPTQESTSQKPSDADIHVMPGKFRTGQNAPGGNKRNRGLVILIIVLAAVLLLGGGAFAFFKYFYSTGTTTNANASTNQGTNVNENSNSNDNINANLNGNDNINASTPTIVKGTVTDPATNSVIATATLTVPAGALPPAVKVVSITSLSPTIGAYATSSAYQAIGGVYLISPSSTNLSKKAALELTYTDQQLLDLPFAVKEDAVTASSWNGTDWTPINSLVDKAKNIVTLEIEQFYSDGIAIVVPKPAPTNINSSVNTNTSIVPTLDSDTDGLTNQEELLYGTNPNTADTDGDSYKDGQEVLAGYNPNGTGKLEVNAGIKLYTNTTYRYSLLYPTTWAVGTLNADKLIIFTSTTGEFVQVSIQDNPTGLSAREYYLSQNPSVSQALMKDIASGTVTGILGPDGLNAFFADTSFMYQVTYNIGIKNEANYLTTFTMMYGGLQTGLKGTTSSNSNANTASSNVNASGNTNNAVTGGNTNTNI